MKTLTTTMLSIAAALVASTTLAGATPAHAQSPAYYVATPVAAPAKDKLITRSTLWRSHGTIYFAQRAPDRTAVLCRLLADETGPLASFSAGGKPLDADALATCNAKAGGGPQAVAAK